MNCGIWWRDLLTDLDSAHDFHCNPKCNSNVEIFSLRIKLQRNINRKNSCAHSIPNYIIHILTPLVFQNFLPYTVEVQNEDLKQQIKIEPSEKSSVYSLDLSKEIKLVIKMKYNGLTWSGNLRFTTRLEEKLIVLSTEENSGKQILVNVRVDKERSCNVFFYASYWISNKTGLPLHVKVNYNNLWYLYNMMKLIFIFRLSDIRQ